MRALWAVLIAASAPALADPPSLQWPVDCALGRDCTIEDYMDLDPSPEMRDYMCAFKTRNGHRGTDIHIMSFEAMERGVDVLAAAPGRVDAIRDGMEDVAVTPETRAAISSRGCGNAIRIDHGGGWQTLYCHLKKGSIQVGHDQRVNAGQPIGQIGLSGLTNVPHLHLTVLKDGQAVDPFLPAKTSTTCGTADGPGLWASEIPYDRTGFQTIGYTDGAPDLTGADTGTARRATIRDTDPMVLYALAFLAAPGDTLRFWSTGPNGREMFRSDVTLDDPKRTALRFVGRRAPSGGWAAGLHRGYVQILRDDRIIAHRHADVTVTD
ncbi:MAG: M23 family metallopeptidase [Pseudomonadota bacterium]